MTISDRTSESFGYEWSKFDKIQDADEENFLSYLFLEPADFAGKDVVDAGCGNGRFSYWAAKYGAKSVLAFDASEEVVKVAKKNLKPFDNVKTVAVDIRWVAGKEMADIVMCIGVLHHLEDPEQVVKNLVGLLRPGGVLCIWVYSKSGNRLAKWVYEPIRKITRLLPKKLMYWLCWFPAVGVEVCNRLRLPVFQQYRTFPFRTKWNDAFDVFATPLVKYCGEDEVRRWLDDAGLQDVTIEPRVLNSVKVGIKAMGKKRFGG